MHLIKYEEDRESLLVFLAKLDAMAWAVEWIHGCLDGKHATRQLDHTR